MKLKRYRIRNKITGEWWEGEAVSAEMACSGAGWALGFCEVKEKTTRGAGGWKKPESPESRRKIERDK